MRKYFFIGICGFFGAIFRFFIKNIHIYPYNELISLNTLIVNVTGSFILALFLTLSFEVLKIDEDIRLGISTGFLGAYTTFSTLCKESIGLISKGYYYSSVSYITTSTVLGLISIYFGIIVARGISVNLYKAKNKYL